MMNMIDHQMIIVFNPFIEDSTTTYKTLVMQIGRIIED